MTKKIILATGLLTSVLWADFTLEYKMEGNMKQVVQYKDAQHVMITTNDISSGERGAQLTVGDKRYMVMKEGGKTKYMDMDVMMEQMKQMSAMFGEAPEAEIAEEESSDFKIVKKGKSKTVAGIKGQVWTIEFEEEGRKERLDLVVTDDDNVVDAVNKYMETMKHFSQMGGEGDDGLASLMSIAPGYVTIAFDGMELVKFDEADIPDSVFALPKGMDAGKKLSDGKATVKQPPLCPMTGSQGVAKQLSVMLKPSANGWQQLSSATCLNMMKMTVENAIYQKGDSYIHMSLSMNVEDESGIVATYRTQNMEISNHKKGKIQGKRYQSAYLKRAKQNAIDIKLDNAMLTMSVTGTEKVDLASFADNVLNLSKFVPVKKSKATADDALKSLGAMFGGQGESSQGQGANAPSNDEMKAAGEMLKGLFGQ